MSREAALELLQKYVTSPSLRRHSFAVEAAMREYAKKFGENEEEWGIAGLLHDFDYERFPDVDPTAKTGHPFEGEKLLREAGYPQSVIEAILGHADYTGVPRMSLMAKCLFACDELAGFIVAIAHMRPDKFEGITPEVVRKYMSRAKFSERVSRADIRQGAVELGLAEDEHFLTVISALRSSATALGF